MEAKKPKNVIIKYPGDMSTYYGDCPSCGRQSKSMIIDKYLGHDVTAKDVVAMMILLKLARVQTGKGTDDCYIDIAGYAACGGELRKE